MELKLKLLSTHPLDYNIDSCTVLPHSGQMVFLGRADENEKTALHIFILAGGKLTGRSLKAPCSHCPFILGMIIDGKEKIVVSCRKC